MKYAWFALAVLLAGVVAWAFVFHLNPALDAWGKSAPDLAPTIAKLNGTLDAINAPCTGFHGSVTCGPLAQLSQTEKNVGILAGKSAEQVQQTGTLVTAVAHNLDTVGQAVKDSASHVSMTADSATGALAQAQVDLVSLNAPIKATTGLLLSATDTVDDADTTVKTLNGRLASPDVTIMLSNGAQFTTTAVQLEQKLAACTLHPTLPCVLKSEILFGAQVGGYLLR